MLDESHSQGLATGHGVLRRGQALGTRYYGVLGTPRQCRSTYMGPIRISI